MARGRRLAIAGGAAALAAVAWGARAWFRERRQRSVFPAADAPALLNPLRRVIMPPHRLFTRMGLSACQTVLELGPGPGYYSVAASEIIGEGGRMLCLDLQPGMLMILRERVTASNVHPVVADALQLPLADSSVDAAFLVTVLGETPDQRAVVRELRRVLKPGGVLAFGESFGDPDYVLLRNLRPLCRDAGFSEERWYRDLVGYTAIFRA